MKTWKKNCDDGPLVSIIVPVYNVENYLERCVTSLLNQVYSNIQIILVDDGSTDKSGIICDGFSRKDSRVKVIHKINEGVSEARNVGLMNSIGEYLTFVDSDDYVSEFYISHLLEIMINEKVDVVIGSWINVTDDYVEEQSRNNGIYIWNGKETLYRMLLSKQITGSVCGVLYRSILWENVNFPTGKRHSEDVYASTQIYLKTNSNAYTSEVLYYYYIRKDSTQHTGYSIDKFEELELVERGNNMILEVYPDLWEATNNKLVSSCFHILFFMNCEQIKSSEGKRLIRIIKEKRISMIFGRQVNKKVRFGCLCTFCGIRNTQKLYNFLGFRGKINI